MLLNRVRLAVIALILALSAGVSGQRVNPRESWVATWGAAMVGRPASVLTPPAGAQPPATPPLAINNQTLRQIAHVSVGGTRVRVALSNAFGTTPLTIGAAHVALRDRDASIVAGSDRALSFGRQPSIVVPPGASVLSDAVALTVPRSADVAVDIYFPDNTGEGASPMTLHSGARQTNYVSAPGDHAGAVSFPAATTVQSWFVLTRVDVSVSSRAAVIVTIGDSITDGSGSTPNANARWPDLLARRLSSSRAATSMAVVNTGIGGNRVLSEAPAWNFGVNILARFDRDALTIPGVTHVVVLEGINDIGAARQNPSPGAADLIAGHRQLIARAHAAGVRIIGATLTPFDGAAYFTPEGEAKRQAINQWIRTSHDYDGVIDFDAAVRDAEHPSKFVAKYQSGDSLHPSDAGYEAMANAIDVKLFSPR